ncbi:MAG: helix-turn-helix transcriptional regulator [Sediminibacterium sp.]
MTEIAKQVGYRIRKIRESKDLNQQQMADHLGLTAGAYAKIERGETDPSITRLFEIARVLKTDIMNFIKDAAASSHTELQKIQEQLNAFGKELEQLKKQVGIKKTYHKE